MEHYGSKSFKTLLLLEIAAERVFKLLKFFLMGLTKLFGIFEILKIEILTNLFILLTWDPLGVKISKCHSYKLQPKVFKLFLNFLPVVLTKLHSGFLKF